MVSAYGGQPVQTLATSACADGDGETARWMPGQNRSVESKGADNVLERSENETRENGSCIPQIITLIYK
jgi:hypothetical protein